MVSPGRTSRVGSPRCFLLASIFLIGCRGGRGGGRVSSGHVTAIDVLDLAHFLRVGSRHTSGAGTKARRGIYNSWDWEVSQMTLGQRRPLGILLEQVGSGMWLVSHTLRLFYFPNEPKRESNSVRVRVIG